MINCPRCDSLGVEVVDIPSDQIPPQGRVSCSLCGWVSHARLASSTPLAMVLSLVLIGAETVWEKRVDPAELEAEIDYLGRKTES